MLDASRNGFLPQTESKDAILLTDGHEAIERWKRYFNEHLNGAETVVSVVIFREQMT